MIYDVAVLIPTVLRKSLGRAVRSVFKQDIEGKVQIIVGVDIARGSRDLLAKLKRECPTNMALHVIDMEFSTSRRNGGLYPTYGGGALRTIMSYAAKARYVAYLDDDNWWAPSHLRDLLRVIRGKDWAFSYRWYVDPETLKPLCVDKWESVGPGKGVYKKRFNGFVDTNCLMIDKLACHWLLPAWCIPLMKSGEGEDRLIFKKLHTKHEWACTNAATTFYVYRPDDAKVIHGFIEKSEKARAAKAVAESGSTKPSGPG
jgi:hypothetical protein